MAVAGFIWRADTGTWPGFWNRVALAAIATAAIGVAAYFAFSYNTATSMAASLAAQREVMAKTARPYALSIPWNLYDFALLCGPCAVIMGLCGSLLSLARDERPRLAAGLGFGVVLTVAALVLLGSTRGEVGRIWVFLMPPLLVPAAVPVCGLRGWSLMIAGLLVIVGQLAVALMANSQLLLVAP